MSECKHEWVTGLDGSFDTVCRKCMSAMSEKDEAQAAAEEWTLRNAPVSGHAHRIAYEAFLAGLAKGREVERQRCATLVEEMGKSVKGGYNNAAHDIAAAIRESGK